MKEKPEVCLSCILTKRPLAWSFLCLFGHPPQLSMSLNGIELLLSMEVDVGDVVPGHSALLWSLVSPRDRPKSP